ncbi:MAG: S41 family peptidase [Chitinophagales bacterium]|nr:S41 family peptidase [Chitinophagales bacterium]MDW8418264.1 S41 family peptidase [Chitinophagales bacterium]
MKRILPGITAAAGIAAITAFTDRYFELSKNIEVFSSLYREVNTYYVDDVEPSKLMRNFLDGMLKTLDPYTNYFSQSQIEKARIQQGGKFGGIGIEIDTMRGYPVVTAVWKDQPADKAGIQPGDVILSIDGSTTLNRQKEDVEKFLTGEPKSRIILQIERKISSSETRQLHLNLMREEIQETNVPFFGMITPEIGCIKLKIFNEHAAQDVRRAYDSLKNIQPRLKGLILDLRGNPGGLMLEAVEIVNMFIEKDKLVVATKGKVDEWNNTFKTKSDPVDLQIPIAVLVNSGSASASEIVSGALQDYDRAVIIGQKTFGKGLVQITRPLSYNTMLKVTTAKYYIPSGRCIQAINYAERNEDGSVKRIPDSLKREFKTSAGRKVWDGGGIDPDIPLPKPELSAVAQALERQHLIFDFATLYTLQKNNLEDPATFKLSEKDYNDFLAFIRSRGFAYRTETEQKLEKLKQIATDEKYFDAIQPAHQQLIKKIANEKEQDLMRHKGEIITLLENEIVGRYYYAYGKVKKSYQNDAEVARAVQLLNQPDEIKKILSAKN